MVIYSSFFSALPDIWKVLFQILVHPIYLETELAMNPMVPYLGLFEAFVLAILVAACMQKYGFEFQVRSLTEVPKTFLTFWGNATNWSDFFVANPVTAFLLSAHAASWSLSGFGWIFTVVTIVGAFMLIPLLDDSMTTPSAFFRDGMLPLAGAMHYLLWCVQVSASVSYYVLTPREQVTPYEVVAVTMLLMSAWGIGVLHPPYKVHGSINGMAIAGAVIGWCVLVALAIYLLNKV